MDSFFDPIIVDILVLLSKKTKDTMKKIKLFTFPYAGGNSNIFRSWKKQLNSIIELHSVELSGKGTRMFEPLQNSIEEIVDDLKGIFIENDSDYAMFGHSMGTMIIFELISELNKMKIKLPFHVFFSGRRAPHIKSREKKKYHLMDKEELKREVIQLGGTPEEIFDDTELADIFLPILKNDLKNCENYLPQYFEKKYDIDFSILAGLDEGYAKSELTAYGNYTTGLTTVHYFKGGHFFIKDSEKEVIEFINSTLLKYRER